MVLHLRSVLLLASLASSASALAAAPAAKPPTNATATKAEPTIEELLNRTDDLMRGSSSEATITMHVRTARWERTLTLQAWSKGTDRTLIRILAPAKEKGTATLKVGENIWNYLPKVDRTIKLPSSMMSGSWMGSHFSNDDLVREARFVKDFTCGFEQRPADNPERNFIIACTPRPDAPVVWGKVVMVVGGDDQLPREGRYYDEKGTLVRTMRYTDVKPLGGRTIPTRMVLVPADKPTELTEISYDALKLDVALPDATFSLQALKP